MNYDNKKIYTAFLIPSLVQALIVAIIAVILNAVDVLIGYTSPIGLLLIAVGGISTAFFGARFQYKYNNKTIKDIVTDFFKIKQPVKFYILIVIFLIIDFAAVITGEGFVIESPAMPLLIFLKAILFGGIEEIGWRYTFQPEMEKRFPYAASTIITFLGWSLWHILYFCIDGSIYFYSASDIVFFLIGLLTNCFILSVIYKKSGSLWLCVMTHALINTGAQMSPYVLPICSILSSMYCIILACVIITESDFKVDTKKFNANETADFFIKYWNRLKIKYFLTLAFAIIEFMVLILLSFVGLFLYIPEIILLGNDQNSHFMLICVYYIIFQAVVLYIYRATKFFLNISRVLSEDCDPYRYCEMYEQLEDNRRFLRGKTGKHFFLSNYYVASCIYITEYSKALDKLHVLRDKNKRKKIRLAAFEYYEGAIAIGENDIDKAKKCLEKINDLVKDINKGKGNKNSHDIVIGLTGLIALKEEDYEKAEALFSQRLIGRKDRISKMSLYYDLGLAKKGLGKEAEARKCFEKAAMYAGDARFELADKVREAYKAYDFMTM